MIEIEREREQHTPSKEIHDMKEEKKAEKLLQCLNFHVLLELLCFILNITFKMQRIIEQQPAGKKRKKEKKCRKSIVNFYERRDTI